MAFFDIQKLIQSYPAIRKQADDALVPNVIRLFNQVLYLLVRQAGQYYPGHLRRVNFNDRVFFDVVLAKKPIAESSNSSVVGVLAIAACELGQEEVNVGVGERATSDKGC